MLTSKCGFDKVKADGVSKEYVLDPRIPYHGLAGSFENDGFFPLAIWIILKP